MKTKAIMFVAVVLLVSVVGFFGYQKYTHDKYMASLLPKIKSTSARVDKDTNYYLHGESITFDEIFKRLEEDIDEINKIGLEIEASSYPAVKDKTDIISQYISSEQNLLRCELYYCRKKLSKNSIHENINRNKEFYNNLEKLSQLFGRKSVSEINKEIKKADNEYDESLRGYYESIKNLDTNIVKMKTIIQKDYLCDKELLDTILARKALNEQS